MQKKSYFERVDLALDLGLLALQLPLAVLQLYSVIFKLFGDTSDGIMAIMASALLIGGLGHSLILKWNMRDEKLYIEKDGEQE